MHKELHNAIIVTSAVHIMCWCVWSSSHRHIIRQLKSVAGFINNAYK